MVHPPGSEVHTSDSADLTAMSEAGLSASDYAAAKPAVPTATGSDATAGLSCSVQTAVQASLTTTTKPVSSALPVDASEGISAEAEPAVCEAASSAVPASADHAAADAQAPVQSTTTSESGSGSRGVTEWVVLGITAWSGLRILLSDSCPLEQLSCCAQVSLACCSAPMVVC